MIDASPEIVPELSEAPQPKKRGRPPGSKNKKPMTPEESEEELVPEEEESEEEESEIEEPVVPRKPPTKPVRMTPPRRAVKEPKEPKEPKRQKSKQPRPSPHPTAEQVAEAMMVHMTNRQYNKSMQRQAMYSSWM